MNFEPQSTLKAGRSTSPRYAGNPTNGSESVSQPNTARIRELKERFDKFKQSREIIDTDRVSNKPAIKYGRNELPMRPSSPRNKSYDNPSVRKSVGYDRGSTPRAAIVDDFDNDTSDVDRPLESSQPINTAEKSDKIQHLEKYLKNVKNKIQNERAKKVENINTYK